MILADTDILSALAKIDRLPLLFTLLRTTQIHIAPGVFQELAHSLSLRRRYAEVTLALVPTGQLCVLALTEPESAFCGQLPRTLGAGERESIALAKERQATVLSNESRVAHYCRQYQIPCLRLPDVLRALWVEGIVSKDDVRGMIADLQSRDHMQFKASTLDAIVSDDPQ